MADDVASRDRSQFRCPFFEIALKGGMPTLAKYSRLFDTDGDSSTF